MTRSFGAFHRLPLILLAAALGAGGFAAGCVDAETPVADSGPEPEEISPLSPDGTHYGSTYGEWSAAWWQWIFGQPLEGHPLNDITGESCGRGQEGPVFFLAGTSGGAVTRSCSIPADTALFFPLLNTAVDNAGVPEADQLSDEELTGYLDQYIDRIRDAGSLYLTLDGRSFSDLTDFESGPDRFSYVLPDGDNLYTSLGLDVHGAVDPAFSGGFWILLPPLPAGEHVLEFGGTSPGEPTALQVDVTYNLTVE